MSIIDLLGGLFFTCIFVVFLVVLLKIIRAVMIIGVKNNQLNTKEKGEEEEEDLKYDENEGKGSSTSSTSTSTSEGSSDPSYWLDANLDRVGELPSPARLSYSVEKPIIVRSNDLGVLSKNSSQIEWLYSPPAFNSKIQDDDDDRLFKLHYFDLKNFQPSKKNMVKPHWDRDMSYVVLECASGGFLHSDMSPEYPTLRLGVTRSASAVTDTNYTDDRFFSVNEHDVVDGVKHLYLKHLASGYIISVRDGFVAPVPFLKYMSSGPSNVDLFFFENTSENNPTAPEGGGE
uniref:Wsv457-like protein n=1 Tax=Hemigrapsus takanoi nimavirus TaxID=2133792 RepID=A0A401IP09_9VIRU|nr:wsv457-like protein [Hemigrapsus takanoi nimavirus]